MGQALGRLAGDPRATADTRRIEAADADLVVAHHLVPLIRRAIAAQPTDQRVANAVAIANDIVAVLHAHGAQAVDGDDEIADIAQVLLAITPTATLPGEATTIPRPTTPLSESDLLTNATGRAHDRQRDRPRDRVGRPRRPDLRLHPLVGHPAAVSSRSGGSRARARRSGSSPPPTSARPSAERSTSWSPPAPRCRCPTTTSTPGCTPRPGCSAATPASRPPTSARRTSRPRPCTTASSGTSASRRSATPSCSPSSRATFDSYWDDAPVRGLRPASGTASASTPPSPGPGGASSRHGSDDDGIDITFLDVTPKPFQAAHPRRARGRAGAARPLAQPRRRGHRHRQDRHRRPRLPPAARGAGPTPRCCSSPTARRS